MTDAGFFRGTSSEQDNRFSDKEKKLLKQMKFSETIVRKVDMSRVNLNILKPWISNRISELLGMEDDVLNEFVINQLEANNNPDGRRIQINLTGFLNGKNARIFAAELWDLLLDAMENTAGVPSLLLNAKKAEISQRFQQQEQQQDEKNQKNSRGGNDVATKSNTPYDDRKSHSTSSSSRYQQQDHHQGHNKHHHQQQQSYRSQDDMKSRKREEDYDDRDRDDRTRSRDDNSRKRSRFSDIQPESDVSTPAERTELFRIDKPTGDPPKIKVLEIQPEDDYEKVEMKKRKKKDKHHHRKRRRSSSSRDDDDDDDDRPKKSRSRERRKKKKKSSSKRHDKSKERTADNSGNTIKDMEQELRVRALESMKKQKRMH